MTGLCRAESTLAELMNRFADLPLSFDPGDRYQYGMSTDVLGRVVEVVSDTTLDRFIENQICRPLGMNDTFFKIPPAKLSRLAATYLPDQKGGIRKLRQGEFLVHERTPISSDYPFVDSHRCLSGGGGLCSTPGDYMRFCQMLLNGGTLDGVKLLRPETVEMMTKDQIPHLAKDFEFGFGFGIMADDEDVPETLRRSYGWGGWWTTTFQISPRDDWIVIAMSQKAYVENETLNWFAKCEKIAAEAIED